MSQARSLSAAGDRTRLLLAAIVLLGAALRIVHLGYRSLDTDEANVYWMARGSLAEVLPHNAAGNSAPPLYALALNPAANRGASEAVLRGLSCAAGILALPVLFALVVQHTTAGGALFATFLVAVAPAQVFYSQYLREYSLAFLCAALLLLTFERFQRAATEWSERPVRRSAAAFALVLALSIAVQYGLALLAVALNIVFLIDLGIGTHRLRRAAVWGVAQLPAIAVAWWVYDTTLRHQLRPGGFGADYLAQGYWDGSAASLAHLTLGNTFELFRFAHPATPLLQALVLLGVIHLWATVPGRRAILLLVMPMVVTIAAACLRLYPYLGARQSMSLTVMLYVAAGAGLVLLRRHDWRGVLSGVVVAWMAAEGLYGSYRGLLSTEPQHLRPVAAALAAQFRGGDRIYVYHDAVTPLLYYYPDEAAHWIRGVASPTDPQPHRQQVATMLAEPGRVWLVFSHCRGGECEVVRRAVDEQRRLERVAADTGAVLYLATER